MVLSSSVKDSELSECSFGFNQEVRVSWLSATGNVQLEVKELIHVMFGEASWPRKTHNYLRKIHWQAVQSVPDQFCPKIRVWYKISLFLILWVKLFSMAFHMSTRVYIQQINVLFEPKVLQLITRIGNQTVWEKSTMGPEKSTPDFLRVESQNSYLRKPTCEI
jgi:hypothetical protein